MSIRSHMQRSSLKLCPSENIFDLLDNMPQRHNYKESHTKLGKQILKEHTKSQSLFCCLLIPHLWCLDNHHSSLKFSTFIPDLICLNFSFSNSAYLMLHFHFFSILFFPKHTKTLPKRK